MTTRNITINFINGDTLTYKYAESALYASIKDIREFIGSNTGNYHLDLIDTTGKKIIYSTIDDNLTCVYTDNTKCVQCECINEKYFNGLCGDCYLNDGDSVGDIDTPEFYRIYRVFNPNQTEYYSYKVFFDDDGEQCEIRLLNKEDEIVEYLPSDERLMTDQSHSNLILKSKVPEIFLDKVIEITVDLL
jgi:hypothetical protein